MEGLLLLVADGTAGKRKRGSDAFESGAWWRRVEASVEARIHYIGWPRVCQSGIGTSAEDAWIVIYAYLS
ncbi:hypothetical protein [Castellaniella sp.]|uniref:hypothetical protein n=1 Tax=Castellaniella sp. TaxID=1955812 RepID=UPI003C789BF7